MIEQHMKTFKNEDITSSFSFVVLSIEKWLYHY